MIIDKDIIIKKISKESLKENKYRDMPSLKMMFHN